MTRPIKFRAKILEGFGWKHHEKWVYGFLFKGPLTMENGPAEHFGGDVTKWFISSETVVWEIDIETVGQFTGLLDKNGKEIYEGDVVKKSGKLYKVGFYSGQFNAGDLWNSQSNRTWEIIGNIYENPELLK